MIEKNGEVTAVKADKENVKKMKIQELRKAAGFSQSGLAKEADVSVRTLQHYEQGDKDINKAEGMVLYRIAVALGCKVEDLLEFPETEALDKS